MAKYREFQTGITNFAIIFCFISTKGFFQRISFCGKCSYHRIFFSFCHGHRIHLEKIPPARCMEVYPAIPRLHLGHVRLGVAHTSRLRSHPDLVTGRLATKNSWDGIIFLTENVWKTKSTGMYFQGGEKKRNT